MLKYLFMSYCLRVFLANFSPATIQLGQASVTKALDDKFSCSVLLKGGHLANFLWDNRALHKREFIQLENANTIYYHHNQTGQRRFVKRTSIRQSENGSSNFSQHNFTPTQGAISRYRTLTTKPTKPSLFRAEGNQTCQIN